MTKFVGFSLPRSGTAWLSNLLTHGEESFCRHEALFGCANIDDYIASIESIRQPVAGSIDTAAGLVSSLMLHRLLPLGYRFFVIVRPMEEVNVSLDNIGLNNNMTAMVAMGMHEVISAIPGIPIIKYEELFDLHTMRALWGYLRIPTSFPIQRFEMLRCMHIEDGYAKGFGRFCQSEELEEAGLNMQSMINSSLSLAENKARTIL